VIDQYAPQMKPRDRRLIYEWMRRRESGVTQPASEEGGLNRRFKKLFEKYEADGDGDALREMLGSDLPIRAPVPKECAKSGRCCR
jgi:hypothetical protein